MILPGEGYPRGARPAREEASLWPFVQVVVAADDRDLETWAIEDFGTDRNLEPKGVVEVPL